MRKPSGLKVMETGAHLSSFSITCKHSPDLQSQSRTVLSIYPAEANHTPSGAMATEYTRPRLPSNVPAHVRASKSQTLMALSSEPEIATRPFVSTQIEFT